MKKYVVAIIILFFSLNATAQQKFEDGIYHRKETTSRALRYLEDNGRGFIKSDYNVGFNLGVCGYFERGLVGFCCGGEAYNISVEVAVAGETKGENRYGNGGVSNDYRMVSTMFGYVGYLKCTNNMLLVINPKMGVCTENQLYNDSYYGSDVANSVGFFEVGIDVGIWAEYFMVKFGITNMKINAQIGFSFLF